MDSAVHPSAPQQRCVRRVHDGIALETGDIPGNDFDSVHGLCRFLQFCDVLL